MIIRNKDESIRNIQKKIYDEAIRGNENIHKPENIFVNKNDEYHYANPLDKNAIQNKAIATLQHRLDSGNITKDEFYKQLKKLSKK